MRIDEQRVIRVQGMPVLEMVIDGIRTRIPYEQKALGEGLVYLGLAFEDVTSAMLAPNPANGRMEAQVLRGFTDDVGVVEAVGKHIGLPVQGG